MGDQKPSANLMDGNMEVSRYKAVVHSVCPIIKMTKRRPNYWPLESETLNPKFHSWTNLYCNWHSLFIKYQSHLSTGDIISHADSESCLLNLISIVKDVELWSRDSKVSNN